MTDRPVPLVGCLVLVATAIVLYAAGIDAPHFADDFQFVFDNPLANTANCLTLIYPPSEFATSFYRPIQTCNSMPFVAAMIGLGLGSLLEAGGQAGFRRRAAVLVGVALLLSHGLAVQSKVRMMRDNGRRASELLPAVINAARNAPLGATITLVTPKPAGPTYSSFLVSDFDLLSDARNWIRISA
jgi:hypothetical protein